MSNKRPIIVVDGMNVFVRHFMVNESVNAKSEPIGGVVGFMRFIDMTVARFTPSKLIVVWENGGPSPRRRRICPAYKDGRSKVSAFKKKNSVKDNLRTDSETKIKQLALLYQLLKFTPVCQIFLKDTECDDIIGYLIKYKFRNEKEREKYIISSDKDFYQLLDDETVKIYDPAKKAMIKHDDVLEKFNISPRNFCLARTLVGDASDNLEGVPGVGLKTVSKRFPGFADKNMDMTIEDVFEGCRDLLKTNKKLKAPKEILESEELIRRNWKLMYLDSSNLSATHIEKIHGTLEQHEPKMDKLGLIKEVTRAKMNMSFDFDRFSISLKQSLIF